MHRRRWSGMGFGRAGLKARVDALSSFDCMNYFCILAMDVEKITPLELSKFLCVDNMAYSNHGLDLTA